MPATFHESESRGKQRVKSRGFGSTSKVSTYLPRADVCLNPDPEHRQSPAGLPIPGQHFALRVETIATRWGKRRESRLRPPRHNPRGQAGWHALRRRAASPVWEDRPQRARDWTPPHPGRRGDLLPPYERRPLGCHAAFRGTRLGGRGTGIERERETESARVRCCCCPTEGFGRTHRSAAGPEPSRRF